MKTSCSRLLPVLALGLSLLPCLLRADVGGGSGRPMGPYRHPESVTADEMARIKKLSSRLRWAEIPVQTTEYGAAVFSLATGYMKDGQRPASVAYAFEGETEDGAKLKVDFADVRDFKVLQLKRKKFLFEITIFPDITPELLLQKRPSFSELAERHTKTVRLWVPAVTKAGELALLDASSSATDSEFALVRTIKTDVKIELRYQTSREVDASGHPIWFAIDTVITDPKYPYRVFAKS